MAQGTTIAGNRMGTNQARWRRWWAGAAGSADRVCAKGGRVVHQITRANAGLHDFQSSRILSAPAERGGPQEY